VEKLERINRETAVKSADNLARFARCTTCTVHHRALCGLASPTVKESLRRIASERRFAPDDTILQAGEPAPFVANVISGVVRLRKTRPDGRTQIVGLMHPSDFLGPTFEEVSDVTAEAVGRVTLCCFEKRAFEQLLRENPEFEHAFLLTVLHELHAARDWMMVLGCSNALERVAAYLWLVVSRAEMQGCTAGGRGARFEIPLSRADLSHFLGLTLETTSRQISRLNSIGVISLAGPRHFTVPDPDVLQRISGLGEPDEISMARP